MADQKQLTIGEYRVGINFNPGGNEAVNQIKRQAADLIDAIKAIPSRLEVGGETTDEIERLKALAMANVEDAAMWAVKAATKPTR